MAVLIIFSTKKFLVIIDKYLWLMEILKLCKLTKFYFNKKRTYDVGDEK